MLDLYRLWFGALFRIFRTRRNLMLENLSLRQQLAVFQRKHPRLRRGPFDKLFWVLARRFWSRWKEMLVLVLSGNGCSVAQGRIQSLLGHARQGTKEDWWRSENFQRDR
jgi:hypothetical protein